MNNTNLKKEICIVMAGSVDAGKSSYVGVITSGELDDGNGYARSKVAKHPHEIKLGKTSDISCKNITLSNKEIMLVDLCGHEKYFKTTLYGLTGYFPDYGILVVAANKGILPMTKEHLTALHHMKIPFIILITRIDIAPEGIYDRTVRLIKKSVRGSRKKVIFINNLDDFKNDKSIDEEKVKKYGKMIKNNPNLIPVITISNKTGFGINTSKNLLESLEPREIWNDEFNVEDGSLFYIDSSFNPVGIGMVVSGLLKGGSVEEGSNLLLGPYGNNFIPIRVWSIHDNNRNKITELKHRQRGCFAFRVVDKKIDFNKNKIRKGMMILTPNLTKNICYQFKAKIRVLHHSTTISKKYAPVIHCRTIRQTARIILDESTECLKTGDSAEVSFRYVGHPEYMELGTILFFREGTTRGVGVVKDILPLSEDPNQNPARPKYVRRKRRKKVARNNIKII